MKILKSQQGFTLGELLIVIAIIGVLTSVAVPEFKGFVYKSRMTEAKLALTYVNRAEQAWYANHGTYTTCLRTAGFQPGPSHYFSVGFTERVAATPTWPIEALAECPNETSALPATFTNQRFYQGTRWIDDGTGTVANAPTRSEITGAGFSFTVSNDGQTYAAGAAANIGDVTYMTAFDFIIPSILPDIIPTAYAEDPPVIGEEGTGSASTGSGSLADKEFPIGTMNQNGNLAFTVGRNSKSSEVPGGDTGEGAPSPR
jgi:prepilin-type N-terminal cleavage/methylation domain-containing protein